MAAHWFALNAERLLRLCETDKFNWNDSPLMEKLEETVLTICSWFSKVYNSCLVVNLLSFCVDSLSIALHIKLLNVWGKFAQGLTVWYDGSGRIILNHGSIESQQSQKHWNIFLNFMKKVLECFLLQWGFCRLSDRLPKIPGRLQNQIEQRVVKHQSHSKHWIFLQQNPKIQRHFLERFRTHLSFADLSNMHKFVSCWYLHCFSFLKLCIHREAIFCNFWRSKWFKLLWMFSSWPRSKFIQHLNLELRDQNQLGQRWPKTWGFFLHLPFCKLDEISKPRKRIRLKDSFLQFRWQ